MASQIIFFEKNKLDIDNESASITVTDLVAYNDGADFVNRLRNRDNRSAWMTTDSTDAANTQLDIDLGEDEFITDIILVKHNFKSYTIQYWNGSTYINFSTVIAPSNDTKTTSHYNFNKIETDKIRIIIYGTQIADADKELFQLIITDRIAQLNGWPEISGVEFDTSKRVTKMLSGKIHMTESYEAFGFNLTLPVYSDDDDVAVFKNIYERRSGILAWLCGGDETQFKALTKGYRLEDIYLVRPTNDFSAELYKGLYKSGIKINLQFKECII